MRKLLLLLMPFILLAQVDWRTIAYIKQLLWSHEPGGIDSIWVFNVISDTLDVAVFDADTITALKIVGDWGDIDTLNCDSLYDSGGAVLARVYVSAFADIDSTDTDHLVVNSTALFECNVDMDTNDIKNVDSLWANYGDIFRAKIDTLYGGIGSTSDTIFSKANLMFDPELGCGYVGINVDSTWIQSDVFVPHTTGADANPQDVYFSFGTIVPQMWTLNDREGGGWEYYGDNGLTFKISNALFDSCLWGRRDTLSVYAKQTLHGLPGQTTPSAPLHMQWRNVSQVEQSGVILQCSLATAIPNLSIIVSDGNPFGATLKEVVRFFSDSIMCEKRIVVDSINVQYLGSPADSVNKAWIDTLWVNASNISSAMTGAAILDSIAATNGDTVDVDYGDIDTLIGDVVVKGDITVSDKTTLGDAAEDTVTVSSLFRLRSASVEHNPDSLGWVIGTSPINKMYATYIGDSAGRSNSGAYPTQIGYRAGYSNSGDNPTQVGYYAGFSNSGASPTQIGYYTGFSNSGANPTQIGCQAGRSNSGVNPIQVGYYAGYFNTGANPTQVGYFAGRCNSGAYPTQIGLFAGYFNSGTRPTQIGVYAGYFNNGDRSTALGDSSFYAGDGDNNTALGASSFNAFGLNAGSAKTFNYTNINIANEKVYISAHGLGSVNEYLNVFYEQGTSAVTGLTDNTKYQIMVAHADSIQFKGGVNITNAGSGTGHTITPQNVYTNTTAIGYNAEPTASNQVVLGDSNVTEVWTAGGITTLGGITIGAGSVVIDSVKISGTDLLIYANGDGTPFKASQ